MDSKQILTKFYQKEKRMPTYSEMVTLFGYKSKNGVYGLVLKLVKEGMVTKDKLGRIVPTKLFAETKVLGLIKAGFPSPAEEELQDTMSLDDYMIEKKESTYILEVDGDSMVDACIAKGDMIIAERTDKAKDGQIVIAEIDGEFTMKFFRKKGDRVWLEAANKKYPPMHPENNLKITAVVKGILRKY